MGKRGGVASVPRTSAETAASIALAKGLAIGAVVVVRGLSGEAHLVVTKIETIDVEGSVDGDVRVCIRPLLKKQASAVLFQCFDASSNAIEIITSAQLVCSPHK